MRDIEPIFAFEREEEVVTCDPSDVLRLEAEQAPDAVILVHDVIADTEVGKRLERAAEPRVDPRGPFAEDLRVRKQRHPEVSPHEATASRADDECERRLGRQGVDVIPNDRLDPSQESLRPERFTLVRERHDHAASLPDHRGKLVLGFGEAAGGDGGPLCLEDMRLRTWKRVEPRRTLEVGRVEPLLPPHTDDVVELPDEVGRPVEQRDEVAVVLGQDSELRIAIGPLARREDHGLVNRVERALRERRERPDLLDVVSEELHAQRLAAGAREDVHETAAHCELPALFHPLDAFVARDGERLDESVEAGAVRATEVHDIGSCLPRRDALGERPRRDADEPASFDYLERASALPDEVSGWLEAGSRVNPAAREQCDLCRIDVPADRLGEIARFLVLGEEAHERAAERAVECGEKKRENRLGDACVRREVVCECAKAFALGESVDEPRER